MTSVKFSWFLTRPPSPCQDFGTDLTSVITVRNWLTPLPPEYWRHLYMAPKWPKPSKAQSGRETQLYPGYVWPVRSNFWLHHTKSMKGATHDKKRLMFLSDQKSAPRDMFWHPSFPLKSRITFALPRGHFFTSYVHARLHWSWVHNNTSFSANWQFGRQNLDDLDSQE